MVAAKGLRNPSLEEGSFVGEELGDDVLAESF
jgi:hypothetical protein